LLASKKALQSEVNDIMSSLRATLDREYGIGTMEHVSRERPAAFTYDYGKTYFLQVFDTAPILRKGETFAWRGEYRFYWS